MPGPDTPLGRRAEPEDDDQPPGLPPWVKASVVVLAVVVVLALVLLATGLHDAGMRHGGMSP